jgi:hypothetical protein
MTIAIFAAACGGGGSDNPAQNDGGLSAGLTKPNTWLTYNGERYQLLDLLQQDMVRESEFSAVGEATEADVDHDGPLTVFTRGRERDVVYTYSPPTNDDGAFWLRWEKYDPDSAERDAAR